jgi:hypothetical protein
MVLERNDHGLLAKRDAAAYYFAALKDFILKRDLWLSDLFAAVCFGTFVTYVLQLIAESGEYRSEELMPAAFIGGASFIFAYFAAILVGGRSKPVPSWVWIGIGGAFILIAVSIVSFFLIGRFVPFINHAVAVGLFIVPYLLTVRTIAYLLRQVFLARP